MCVCVRVCVHSQMHSQNDYKSAVWRAALCDSDAAAEMSFPPAPTLTVSLLQVIWNGGEISIEMILLTASHYLRQLHTKQTA